MLFSPFRILANWDYQCWKICLGKIIIASGETFMPGLGQNFQILFSFQQMEQAKSIRPQQKLFDCCRQEPGSTLHIYLLNIQIVLILICKNTYLYLSGVNMCYLFTRCSSKGKKKARQEKPLQSDAISFSGFIPMQGNSLLRHKLKIKY